MQGNRCEQCYHGGSGSSITCDSCFCVLGHLVLGVDGTDDVIERWQEFHRRHCTSDKGAVRLDLFEGTKHQTCGCCGKFTIYGSPDYTDRDWQAFQDHVESCHVRGKERQGELRERDPERYNEAMRAMRNDGVQEVQQEVSRIPDCPRECIRCHAQLNFDVEDRTAVFVRANPVKGVPAERQGGVFFRCYNCYIQWSSLPTPAWTCARGCDTPPHHACWSLLDEQLQCSLCAVHQAQVPTETHIPSEM
jgi:hypothetical protein